MDEQDDNWDDHIDGALFAINTNVSTMTKCSPFVICRLGGTLVCLLKTKGL